MSKELIEQLNKMLESGHVRMDEIQTIEQAADRIEELEDQVFSKQGAISILNNMNNALLAENSRLRDALLEISQVACSLSPEQKIANEALAKVRKP